MKVYFPRWVWRTTGISLVKLGPCDCDQDYCLVCEIKFRVAMKYLRLRGKV